MDYYGIITKAEDHLSRRIHSRQAILTITVDPSVNRIWTHHGRVLETPGVEITDVEYVAHGIPNGLKNDIKNRAAALVAEFTNAVANSEKPFELQYEIPTYLKEAQEMHPEGFTSWAKANSTGAKFWKKYGWDQGQLFVVEDQLSPPSLSFVQQILETILQS